MNGYQVILDLNVAHNYKFILYWFPNMIFSIVNWSYDYLPSELNKFSRRYKTGIYKTTKYLCEDLYFGYHYNDVIMSAMAYQITSLTIVYSIVYSGADQRKNQSFASQAFVCGIHRWPMNSLHKGPVTRKMFPFDDVIMFFLTCPWRCHLMIIWLLFIHKQFRSQRI